MVVLGATSKAEVFSRRCPGCLVELWSVLNLQGARLASLLPDLVIGHRAAACAVVLATCCQA